MCVFFGRSWLCFVLGVGTLWVCTAAYSQKQSSRIDHRQVDVFPDATGTLQPIRNVQDWQVRKADVLAKMQQVTGTLPAQARQQLPVKYEVKSEQSGEGYVRRTIEIAAEPGRPVIADLYLPAGASAQDPRAGIVALHPTGAQGKRIVAGEGPRQNRQYGVELAQRGYVVICPDYPSFGDLGDYNFAEDGYDSGTMKGIVNHMRCVDLLCALPEVKNEQIGVIGHSLGGHNAIFLAVFDERVTAVVSSCGWTPFHDYKEGNLTGWTSDRYMPRIKTEYQLNPDLVPFDFPELIASLAPRWFFSSSPVSDDNFSVEGAKRGMAAAKSIFELHGVPERLQLVTPLCEHDFPTEIRSDAYQFLDRALGHKPARELNFGGELPRIEPLSPEQALASFVVAPGYRMELTAAEPLVVDPVAMCFDENGSVYVAEMRGYSEDDGLNLGRISLLQDTDGDGRFDQSTVFVEGLSWPTAVLCYDGGVFVGAAPDIHYFKDTNGDGVADVREVVYTGFGKRNVQALLNSFRWGLDNRIYGATSSNGGLVRRPDQPESAAINLSGRNFSFNPKTRELRAESGASQHGMSFDDWGRLFVCSNSDHFQMVLYEDRYAARNPYLKAPSARMSVAADGSQAEVYRISPVEPWRVVRTRLRASGRVQGAVEFGGKNSGYFTSATGVNFFRGDGWHPEDKGIAVIGDVGSNIIHRKRVQEDGLFVLGQRMDEKSELVSSSDIWFRPVQYENGPDGAMHVLDMYREVIEHPWSLPPEIKQHLDLTSGRDRGRLYRIVATNYQHRATPRLSQATLAELVELLDHPNAWHRESASRLLYERQDPSAKAMLQQAFEKFSPLGKLHVLYALQGQAGLSSDLVLRGLQSEEAQLRRHAVRLSEAFAADTAIQQCLTGLVEDPAAAVRYQLAFTLGEFPSDWRAPLISRMLLRDGESRWMRFALMTSLGDQSGAVLLAVSNAPEFSARPEAGVVLTELVELIARRQNPSDVASFSRLLDSGSVSEGMKKDLYRTFALNSPRTADLKSYRDLETWRDRFLQQARELSSNEKLPVAQRVQGITALSVSRDPADITRLLEFCDQRHAEVIQLAALETLVALGGAGTDQYLVETWPSLGPALRKQAQQALFSRPAWTVTFLKAILAQQIPRADVDRTQLQVLASSKSEDLRKMAAQVTASLQDSPRADVIEKYRAALDLTGDVARGRALFVKHCSGCHRLEGNGKPTGPNLASFRNRGKEAFLINILDPSREVTPDYLNYLVVMADGRTYTGLLASQSATTISIQRAEGDPVSLLRAEIEEMRSSGISLMPEGLEKDVPVDAFADLLTYLMQAE
ncbi:MAG: alpha/beta fold hydrolase [Planctomycetaceae bacterium]|nr:alpha/beta fold hydrolase [Planctomycetaceae bacterium]